MSTATILKEIPKPSVNGKAKPNDILSLISHRLEVHSSVKINPQQAEDLLTLNTKNRMVVHSRVDAYANMMSQGKWLFCGNTLKVSRDMVLQDGQKSLMAVVKSGTSQIFNIQTGLEPEAFSVMDTGDMRSAGDVLYIKGYPNYNSLAAAIKSVCYWEGLGRLAVHVHKQRITNLQVDEWSENKTNMKLMVGCVEFARVTQREKKGTFMAVSTWAFVYYILSKIHREQATEFVTLLAHGENISTTKHPAVYLLREKLLNFELSGHNKIFMQGGTAVTELKLRYIIRAWNAWRTKEKITKLQINTKEEKIEKPV